MMEITSGYKENILCLTVLLALPESSASLTSSFDYSFQSCVFLLRIYFICYAFLFVKRFICLFLI